LVSEAIRSGRYVREEEVLREAMSLWERQERRRAEILAAVDQAEASFSRGAARRISTKEECRQVANEVERKGLARLQAQSPPAADNKDDKSATESTRHFRIE
jgi:Arc/MetJ-type ribon-helix-helix transcriptional regulator